MWEGHRSRERQWICSGRSAAGSSSFSGCFPAGGAVLWRAGHGQCLLVSAACGECLQREGDQAFGDPGYLSADAAGAGAINHSLVRPFIRRRGFGCALAGESVFTFDKNLAQMTDDSYRGKSLIKREPGLLLTGGSMEQWKISHQISAPRRLDRQDHKRAGDPLQAGSRC